MALAWRCRGHEDYQVLFDELEELGIANVEWGFGPPTLRASALGYAPDCLKRCAVVDILHLEMLAGMGVRTAREFARQFWKLGY